MKKIGFIDYYLNEWHADNYPDMIEKESNGEFKVCYAWAYRQPPEELGRISNEEWAKQHGVELLGSMEEVIEKSDCLIVLSPDNPEMYEELCKPIRIVSIRSTVKDRAVWRFTPFTRSSPLCV